MRAIDRTSIEETRPVLYQMMENIGRNLAFLSMELLDENWSKANIVVLAGTGDNGGGIYAARHMANRNAHVKLSLSNLETLTDMTAFQIKVFKSIPGEIIDIKKLQDEPVDFIFDSIIGYSLKRAPRGRALKFIRWLHNAEVSILSLDVNSGVDSTTGKTSGEFIHPNWTMTLALPKTGVRPETGRELHSADIGIPQKTFDRLGLNYISPFRKDYFIRMKTDP